MNIHPSLMYGGFQRSLKWPSTLGSREDVRVPFACFGILNITKYHLKAFVWASKDLSTLLMKINLAPFFFWSPIQKAGASLTQKHIFQPIFFHQCYLFWVFFSMIFIPFLSAFKIPFLIPVENFSFMIISRKVSVG